MHIDAFFRIIYLKYIVLMQYYTKYTCQLFNILYRNVGISYIYEMLNRICYTWLHMLIVNNKRSSSIFPLVAALLVKVWFSLITYEWNTGILSEIAFVIFLFNITLV